MASNDSDPPPRIGISTYVERARWGVWDREAALIPTSYTEAVLLGGGVPLLLPVLPDGAAEVLDAVDGLVLAGGPDVDPSRYGQQPHATAGRTRPERDAWELALLRRALEDDVPVLAVCRGAQLLNVALGGTLHQHLPDSVNHEGHQPAPAVFGRSEVELRPGSLAARVLGERVDVPCYHHQGLATTPAQLRASGHAADGTIEAIELPQHSFALGIQWHPEEAPDDARLFEALVAACRASDRFSKTPTR